MGDKSRIKLVRGPFIDILIDVRYKPSFYYLNLAYERLRRARPPKGQCKIQVFGFGKGII